MVQKIKIAVLGGGGRTGKYLVSELLSQGYALKLLLRNPEKFQLVSPHIEIIRGDALDLKAIRSLVNGCQAVISSIGQRQGEPLVASLATKNILQAMVEEDIKRFIQVAGINVDTPYDKKGAETAKATEWMKMNFPLIQEDRQKAYTALTLSLVKWTLVRVPFIEFTESRSQTIVGLEDCPGTKICAPDIAAFLVRQLGDETYVGKAPFISNP